MVEGFTGPAEFIARRQAEFVVEIAFLDFSCRCPKRCQRRQYLAGQDAGQDEAAGDDDGAGRADDEQEQHLHDALGHAFADAAFSDERRIAGSDDRRPAVGGRVAEKETVAVPGHDRLLAMGFFQDPVGQTIKVDARRDIGDLVVADDGRGNAQVFQDPAVFAHILDL